MHRRIRALPSPTPSSRSEPRLEELLADPVMRAVMARDGVTLEEIIAMVCRYRAVRMNQA